MISEPSFSSNGVHQTTPPPEKKSVPALVIGLIVIPLLLLIVIPTALVISSKMGKPAFATIGELKTDEISRLEVQLQNLKASYKPDRKDDDLGPYVARAEDYERLVNFLRTAEPVDELPPKVFLGSITIHLKDGKHQVVRLSFIPEGSTSPVKRIAFKIGPQSFLGGPVADFVVIAEACDPRPKKQ
jgi:hypothetical protein